MIKNILTNLAYLFYPRNICSVKDENNYLNSEEYRRLLVIIEQFRINFKEDTSFEKAFSNDLVLKNIQNLTLYDWQDRSFRYSITVIVADELYTFTIYLSFLVPFYVIKVEKNFIELIFTKEQVEEMKKETSDSRSILELQNEIASIIESISQYTQFPEELLEVILDDISFQDIYFSRFNLYNAFFDSMLPPKFIEKKNNLR